MEYLILLLSSLILGYFESIINILLRFKIDGNKLDLNKVSEPVEREKIMFFLKNDFDFITSLFIRILTIVLFFISIFYIPIYHVIIILTGVILGRAYLLKTSFVEKNYKIIKESEIKTSILFGNIYFLSFTIYIFLSIIKYFYN